MQYFQNIIIIILITIKKKVGLVMQGCESLALPTFFNNNYNNNNVRKVLHPIPRVTRTSYSIEHSSME